MIRIEPCAGLGNRLLALASAYWWSKELEEELVVLWKKEVGMGARLGDLFDLPDNIRVIYARDFGYRHNFPAQCIYNIIRSVWKMKSDFIIDCDGAMNDFRGKGHKHFEECFKQNKNKYIKAFSEFYDLDRLDAPLGFIIPNGIVQGKIDNVLGDVDTDHNVGVHIRRTDNSASINNSPLHLFTEAMEAEIESDNDTTFYVASDDEAVIEEMAKRFGNRVRYMKDKCFGRESVEGIQDALAELFCLSHSQKILGSYASSYSRIASMISGSPLHVMGGRGGN